jgi:PAS domain S-box-containing protein
MSFHLKNEFKMVEKINDGIVLNVLSLEDSVQDFEIICEQLTNAGYNLNISRVEKESEFASFLRNNKYDIILVDFKLPGFDAFGALRIYNKICPEVPFICVSGSIGEETAIELIKNGAVDYALKDKLGRLPVVIKRALAEAKEKETRRLAEEALREREQSYRTLADSGHALVWTSGTDKLCNYFNRVWLEFTGRSLEQEKGNGWTEGVHPDDMQRCLDIYVKAFDKREKFSMEYRLRRNDGIYRWIIDDGCPRYDSKGEFIGYIGHCLDITERKRAEEALSKEQHLLNSLIETTPDSIYFKDNNSCFIRINTTMTNRFGLNDPHEALGKTDFDFFDDEHALQAFEDEKQIIATGEPLIDKEEKEIWPGGLTTWVSTTKMPLRNQSGEIIGIMGISRDITDRRLLETELRAAKEKAEESDRLKTAFLHNISHEIRTPMNAIVGFSGFLNEPGLSPNKRKHFTDVIIQSSNQLLSVITNIIDIATVEAGQERVQETNINLNAICKLIYEQYLSKAQSQHITLQYETTLSEEEAIIRTDETKLIQVLSNIVGNSLKFTIEGYVNFGYQLKNNYIEFFVKDTGIGIPKEKNEEIFKRFHQVDNSYIREFGGSGLGLSISIAYIELLGGKMWLDSQLDKGSTFYFTIPYQKTSPGELSFRKPAKGITIGYDKPKTFLIAEDEDFNFMLLEVLLAGINSKIIRARNGIEAVEICKSNQHIDLVLMDIKMPLMNGYEATKQIREFLPNLPIIAQTAYTTDFDKKKALEYGCNDFISKPLEKKLLVSMIKEQLCKS